MLKRKIFSIVLASIMCLSVFLQPLQTQAEEIPTSPVLSDGYTESFVDEFGNTIKLEYIINEEEFKVNTYLDGTLIDYSVRKMERDGEYSFQIQLFTIDY